jgi:hypothetical protein
MQDRIAYTVQTRYQPLPTITEDVDLWQTRLRGERDPHLRPRLPLLGLLTSGQVTTRGQAAAHLAVHRHTITGELRPYRHGGLEALCTSKEPGAPAGQQTLPPTVCTQLQARLATPTGFASSVALQPWLREALALAVPSPVGRGAAGSGLRGSSRPPHPLRPANHNQNPSGRRRACEP